MSSGMFKRVNAWSVRPFEPLAVPVVRLCLALRLSPNVVTVISFVIALGAAAAFWLIPGYWGLLAGALIFQFAFLFDLADGAVARLTGRTSEFGARLDEGLDKINKIACLAAILYSHWWLPAMQWPWLVFGIVLIVVSYLLRWVPGAFRVDDEHASAALKRLRDRGILDWWDPLDTQFVMVVVAPLAGPGMAWVWAAVCLVLVVKVIASRLGRPTPAGGPAGTEGEGGQRR